MYAYNARGLEGRKYGLVGLGGNHDANDQLFSAVSESQIVSPSRMIALGDGVRGWNETFQDSVWVLGRTYEAQDQGDSTSRVKKRHDGRLNVIFCDNHVESIRLNQLFADQSDSALQMWNRDNQPHRDRLR